MDKVFKLFVRFDGGEEVLYQSVVEVIDKIDQRRFAADGVHFIDSGEALIYDIKTSKTNMKLNKNDCFGITDVIKRAVSAAICC